jgi:hypothetical protein
MGVVCMRLRSVIGQMWTNPKSKPYKIRRAMLQTEEARDNQLVLNLPAAEHFTTPYNGRERVLEVRVTQREKDGRQVSLVDLT